MRVLFRYYLSLLIFCLLALCITDKWVVKYNSTIVCFFSTSLWSTRNLSWILASTHWELGQITRSKAQKSVRALLRVWTPEFFYLYVNLLSSSISSSKLPLSVVTNLYLQQLLSYISTSWFLGLHVRALFPRFAGGGLLLDLNSP